MPDVFISYARDDRAKVDALAAALAERGFDVWWDSDLLPGQRYANEIDDNLSGAAAVIVVWSHNSVDRNWVLDEAAVGRDRGVLVPVLVDPVEAPLGFRQVDSINLAGWPQAGQTEFERLVSAITRLRGAAPARPARAARVEQPAKRRGSAIGRGFIVLAVAAAAVLSWIAYDQIVRPPVVTDVTDPIRGDPRRETTDNPGAPDTFGLTDEEMAGFGPQDLIRLALSNTTLDAIEASAAADERLGHTFLCLARAYGEETAVDLPGARLQCEAAAAQGDPLAKLMLAGFHRRGEGGYTADPVAADALLAEAAAAGDPRALTEQAREAIRAGRPEDAVVPVRAAADVGHHPAEILLAWMYENGQGLDQNLPLAFQWYDQAAEKAYPAALTATARMLEEGQGVLRDPQRAFDRYTEASALGDPEAHYRLGRMYERGEGAPADANRARLLIEQAAAAGYEPAVAAMAPPEPAPTLPPGEPSTPGPAE